LDEPDLALQKMLLCDLVRWKPLKGTFADPATTARRARNAPAGADLGRAMSGATARGRDQHTVRGERAPGRASRSSRSAAPMCVRAQKHFSLQSPI
jgi:hypothetical protein